MTAGLGAGGNGNRPSMTADSDDTIPERVDHELEDPPESDEHDGSIVDRMRGSGVGVEDPDIVGDAHPGPVDAEIAEDDAPQI